MAVADRSLTRLLNQRWLFLSPEPERAAATDAVYVCVDDGFPGGVPIGHVTLSDTGTWSAYARVRPGRVFAEDEVSTGLPSLEDAVRAVLEHARYDDVTADLESLDREAGCLAKYAARGDERVYPERESEIRLRGDAVSAAGRGGWLHSRTSKQRKGSMEAIVEPDWKTVGILGAARGGALATDGAAIGTEHLLAAITTSKGPAREALADEGATQTALLAVIRGRMGRDDAWRGADGAEGSVGAQDVLGEDGDRRDRFTGAAAGALTAAMGQARREGAAKFGAVHLLRALLEEGNRAENSRTENSRTEDSRAVELLGVCGISPQAVRDRLDHLDSGTGSTGGAGGREDGLAPHLHATRDVLLGRAPYRHLPLWKRWLVKSAGTNLASKPAWWAGMETYEQARRLGDRAVGTEHVLLAVLATHEVALRYPHLAGENAPAPDTRYAGGERLAGLGIDYASVRDALTGDRVRLTTDARSVEWYLDEATTPGPGPEGSADSGGESPVDPGTGPLVEILLKEETRARQLVDALTATPGD